MSPLKLHLAVFLGACAHVSAATLTFNFSDFATVTQIRDNIAPDGTYDSNANVANGSGGYQIHGHEGTALRGGYYAIDLSGLGIASGDIISATLSSVFVAAYDGGSIVPNVADINIFSETTTNPLLATTSFNKDSTGSIGTFSTSTATNLRTAIAASSSYTEATFKAAVDLGITPAEQALIDQATVSAVLDIAPIQTAIDGDGVFRFSTVYDEYNIANPVQADRTQSELTLNGKTNFNGQGTTGTFGDLGINNGLILTIETVPEPSAALLAFIGAFGLFARRRK